jgi:hypothetical protein
VGSALNLEGQVQREQQALAVRPEKCPQAPGDNMLATEVIERMATAFAAETDALRAGIEQLKTQATRERKELESLIVQARNLPRDRSQHPHRSRSRFRGRRRSNEVRGGPRALHASERS